MAAYVLLVETTQGDTVGVRFPTIDEARDWEDDNDVTAVGAVRIVSKRDALKGGK